MNFPDRKPRLYRISDFPLNSPDHARRLVRSLRSQGIAYQEPDKRSSYSYFPKSR